MIDEFEKHLRTLLESCQEYLEKNHEESVFMHQGPADINCPVHKKINVKYIGSRYYEDGELLGEPACNDYHRKFFLISFKNKDDLSSFNATWSDWDMNGAIDYWAFHLADPNFDTEDDWSINDDIKLEFIKLFK